MSLGAYHGVEYPYIFDTHDPYFDINDTDLALRDVMQAYWVSFAAGGDPNTATTTNWQRFKRPEMVVQELGDTVMTVPAPELELCALFEEGLADRPVK